MAAATGAEVGGACGHHAQRDVCASRAKYREGRRPRAVKVYTVNLESRYLLIQGVPALGVMKELVEQFALYGAIEEYNALDEYPAEQFTEVYLIKFQKLQNARAAKKKMDERNFFGSLLHVCYAPEFETVQETREKLQDRRKYIAKATSSKDHFSKMPQEPKRTVSNNSEYDFQSPTSGFRAADRTVGNWDPSACFPDFYKTLHCDVSAGNIAHPSGYHSQSHLASPQCVHYSTKAYECFSYNPSLKPAVQQGGHKHVSASPALQRTFDNGIDRFMPRATQLEERKRKRDEGNKLGIIGTNSDINEVVIGPQLPEMPKVDMEDDSLNTSASLIRNKLQEVAASVPETLKENRQDIQAKPLVKQRRRI
ncbi:RNA-binding protein 48 isoform X1 [Alligator mississippiensis]|uniref:RNA-binding protein 48 isoform X1 n=2 Tax=Alligator mississippiensis TaxID=8496 RepID=UPI0003D0FA55|nr:RNA-binding protein 48 isoform X1 [Alligator mississippiensis]